MLNTMMFSLFSIYALASLLLATSASARPHKPLGSREALPTVRLDQGNFVGRSLAGVSSFLGIPFALPPLGPLRFSLPFANAPYSGAYDASKYGPSCPQQIGDLPLLPEGSASDIATFVTATVYGVALPDDEDCLTVNVFTPANVNSSSKLPVVSWIYGGGFELGTSSTYDGSTIISRSVELNAPIIFVSLNYRYGLVDKTCKEVKAAGVGNLGLHDQRLALRWIQKYIGAFGGDSTKVTIWGESAGAVSVGLQMITNDGNTEGLFRAGIMQSGSPLSVDDLSKGQPYYDALVQRTGCAGTADTLVCLRTVPYQVLKASINDSPGLFSYQSLALAWMPRTDGVFLKENPETSVQRGSVANIPFITGDCDDEGTIFSLSTLNVTTSAQFGTYMQEVYYPAASTSDIAPLLDLYPPDVTQGSPFDTGVLNAVSPQFKRLSAIVGDLWFQAPRRLFLDNLSSKQHAWAYLSKRAKGAPVLGASHASDLLNSFFLGGELLDSIIHFTVSLDANAGEGQGIDWPKYDMTGRNLLTFLDGLIPQTITKDTYRKEGLDYLTSLNLQYPL